MKYEKLFLEMLRCERCFSRKEKLLLPGTGNINSDIMFIGEAPSKNRDYNLTFGEKSRPVFESFLEHCNLTRDSCFITNAIKCIVPKKKVGDIKKCKDFLEREIEIIDPRVLVLVGKVAIKNVLGKNYKFGTTLNLLNRKVVCIPHPMTVVYGKYSMTEYIKYAKEVRL